MKNASPSPWTCNVVGPTLLYRDPVTIGILVAFPKLPDMVRVVCVLADTTGKSIRQTSSALFGKFNAFYFEFSGMRPGVYYTYSFSTPDGLAIDLSGISRHRTFRMPTGSPDAKAILMSCHNWNAVSGTIEKKMAMVTRLLERKESVEDVELLIRAGDQLYNDHVAKSFLKVLKIEQSDEIQNRLRNALIESYLAAFGSPKYRELISTTPTISVPDDHDFTDGDGSDKHSFTDEELTIEYALYGKIALEAIMAFQTGPNPGRLPVLGGTTSMIATLSRTCIFALDLRAERNVIKKQLMSPEKFGFLLNQIENCGADINEIWVICSVTPARMSMETDKHMMAAFGLIDKIIQRVKVWANQKFGWDLPIKPFEIEDDILDGLTSEANIESLIQLLGALAKQARLGKRIKILSGDVHERGVSEFLIEIEGKIIVFPVIVSSPISNSVKPGASSLAAANQDVVICDRPGIKITLRNTPYSQDRNFAEIPINGSDFIKFHSENFEQPILTGVKLWSQDFPKREQDMRVENFRGPEKDADEMSPD